jgi:hypothetical protein
MRNALNRSIAAKGQLPQGFRLMDYHGKLWQELA